MTWNNYKTLHKIHNPWCNVNSLDTFAQGDKDYSVRINNKDLQRCAFGSANYVQTINNQNPNSKLTFDCFPEPYSGNPDAKVYCLNMNPGEPDPKFDNLSLKTTPYTIKAFENLTHHVKDAFWTDGLVIDKQGAVIYDKSLFDQLLNNKNANGNYIHVGARWQREKTKELWNALNGGIPGIFFLEYFPYHSKEGFEFPDYLPSYEYRNALLDFAMLEEKIIIIMRQEKRWYDIAGMNIGKKLMNYKKKVILKYGRGGWLTRGNMIQPICDNRCDYITWSDIINSL